jgi:hypothetical protein
MFKNILLIGIIISIIFSCNQKPNFPLEPSIAFTSIKKFRILDALSTRAQRKDVFKDSVSISISFKDGDGDLGVNEQEKAKLTEKKEYNYIVKRFVKFKGKFVELKSDVTNSGNFITLKNSPKTGPIEGILNYALEFSPLKSLKADTVKFEIQIIDRAKNPSNVIMTDSVLVYELNKDSIPK